MHATHCFLTNKEDPQSEFEDAVSMEKFPLDENNWYEVMCAVLKNGEIIQYAQEGDYRGRDSFGKSIEELPQEERWQHAYDFALSCMLWEIQSAIQMLPKEYTEIKDLPTLETAIPMLRKAIQDNAASGNSWAIANASKFIGQLEEIDHGFTREYTNAYDSIRMVALTEQEFTDPNVAILFVDIHT